MNNIVTPEKLVEMQRASKRRHGFTEHQILDYEINGPKRRKKWTRRKKMGKQIDWEKINKAANEFSPSYYKPLIR